MSEECVPNIGPAQRRLRLTIGVVGAVVAIALDVALVMAGSARLWRLTTIVPLVAAVYGFLQAYGKT